MATPETRVIYTDLDGTLLGRGGSLFRTAAGGFTMAGAKALELCRDRRVDLRFVSGRSVHLLREDARLLGVNGFIAEAGCVIVRDEGRKIEPNCGPFGKMDGVTVFREIESTGIPAKLFEHFRGSLEYHDPWYLDHEYSHLLRGHISMEEAGKVLADAGGALKLMDNGIIEDRGYGMDVDELHAYHLVPKEAGKGSAIELDLRLSGLGREEAVACGDSASDLEMAAVVRRLYMMSNALENGPEPAFEEQENVEFVESPMVEGFFEAVERALLRPA